MNRRLEKYLVKKFPLCFGDYGKSPMESCMFFGIEFGSGWYKILREACEKAEPIIAKWIEENKIEPNIYIYKWFPSWFPEKISRPITKVFLILIFKFFPKFAFKITYKHIKDWAPRFSQLKEKYGTMRVYFTTYPEGISEIEEEAEERSQTTCETCGQPGKLRGQGWIYCACFRHAKEHDLDNLEMVELKYIKNKTRRKKNV